MEGRGRVAGRACVRNDVARGFRGRGARRSERGERRDEAERSRASDERPSDETEAPERAVDRAAVERPRESQTPKRPVSSQLKDYTCEKAQQSFSYTKRNRPRVRENVSSTSRLPRAKRFLSSYISNTTADVMHHKQGTCTRRLTVRRGRRHSRAGSLALPRVWFGSGPSSPMARLDPPPRSSHAVFDFPPVTAPRTSPTRKRTNANGAARMRRKNAANAATGFFAFFAP